MLDQLVFDKRRLVTIIDPHVKYDQNYFIFSEAKKRGLLVLDSNKNLPYIGNCWPSKSSWIDYFNP